MKIIPISLLLFIMSVLNLANADNLTPNKLVSINGKQLPTRLWALTNTDRVKTDSPDWESLKNGSISYESKNSRLLKIEFKFDEPINNMFIMTISGYAACIGNYWMSKKSFETFTVGWSKKIESNPPNSSTFSIIDLYVIGLNAGEDIDDVSGLDDINLLGLKGKVDISNQKIIAKNMTQICPEWVKPEYLDSDTTQLH